MRKYLLAIVIVLSGCGSHTVTVIPEVLPRVRSLPIVMIEEPRVSPTKCEMPILPLVCTERLPGGSTRISQGTGFLIKNKGKFYIITAGHVVDGAQVIKAGMPSIGYYKIYISVMKILYNETAILNVVGFTSDSDYIELSDKDTFPGQQTIASGYPNGIGYREKGGIALEYDIYNGMRMLSSTCKIQPGMSGGPIMVDCKAVGVNVFSRKYQYTTATRGGLHSDIKPIIEALKKCR